MKFIEYMGYTRDGEKPERLPLNGNQKAYIAGSTLPSDSRPFLPTSVSLFFTEQRLTPEQKIELKKILKEEIK